MKRNYKKSTKVVEFNKQNSKYLLIVESPSKCAKIESYLGEEYKCIASKGHLRELDSYKNYEITFKIAKDKFSHIEQMKKIMKHYEKENIILDFAMRYGNPSIKKKIHKLHEMGCENLVILPLYPQYAAATTATVCDEVYRTLMKMRWQPSIKIIPHYESHPLYIDALVNSLNKKIKEINWKPDLILASYHGIPQKYFDKGDPYHCYCQKTTRLISEKFNSIEIKTTFQSRFGPQKWLEPYTDKTLEKLPKEGKKNVLAICPGFSSDCVETLEEILIQGKESFLESGGENFDMVPCLNDNDDHINLLKSLIQQNM